MGNELPKEFIQISYDQDAEVTFYLDCSPEHSGRVIAIGPGVGEKVVSQSFGEFLEKLLKSEDPIGDM